MIVASLVPVEVRIVCRRWVTGPSLIIRTGLLRRVEDEVGLAVVVDEVVVATIVAASV